MNTYSQAFFSALQGRNLEEAYAELFGGTRLGGVKDGGLDVATGDSRVPYIQVKSSAGGLKDFLAESLRRRKFIPVCVGEPGAREEMLKALLEYGAWIGRDLANRSKVFEAVSQVRMLCLH
ncbi:MAG: hypothetical protein HYT43_00570 [Candidatus Taylorbacteria bacterium]|nr:hypothetical protein [Candidatus Taylorbacteria bacterium]